MSICTGVFVLIVFFSTENAMEALEQGCPLGPGEPLSYMF